MSPLCVRQLAYIALSKKLSEPASLLFIAISPERWASQWLMRCVGGGSKVKVLWYLIPSPQFA